MMAATVKISADPSSWNAAFAKFEALLPELSETARKRVQIFVGAVEAGQEDICVIGDSVTTPGTNELVVPLNPSDAFLGLISTLGTRDA